LVNSSKITRKLMKRNGQLHATNKTSWWKRIDNSIEQRKKMVEKKCEKNLKKAERVSERRWYTMKTLSSHEGTRIRQKRAIYVNVGFMTIWKCAWIEGSWFKSNFNIKWFFGLVLYPNLILSLGLGSRFQYFKPELTVLTCPSR